MENQQQAPLNPQPPQSPIVTPPVVSANAKKSPKNKKMLTWLVLVLVLAVLIGGSYYLGTKKSKPAVSQTITTQTEPTSLEIPKDATVTAECEEGRGKQYILPKDIPDGPIYDVNQGKVVALEYLVGLNEVTTSPDKFMNLLLKNVKYDHITIMPTGAHAGFNEQHIHVIAAMISKTDMDAIKCAAGTGSTSTTDTHMH